MSIIKREIYVRNGVEHRSEESLVDSMHVDIQRLLFKNVPLGPKVALQLMRLIEENAGQLRDVLDDMARYRGIIDGQDTDD